MKPCHAAGLALVGWYLMIPTLYNSRSDRYVPNLPLSQWSIVSSFDSADLCTSAHVGLLNDTAKSREKVHTLRDPNTGTSDERLAFLYAMGECVASDDPRLKAN
jgi:hypothetical protein